jgi:hypothetical protein
MEDELARIREWAQDKLDAQQHIPWDSRRYQHLVALIARTQLLACAGPRAANIVDLDSARRRSRARANTLRTSS